ncbi:hypothetical protein CCUS01_03649 [Colletotrichum cuscutae]|uniref:Uncharacterized protein n=1 Tax=Colletotrichum cuscutae TaxID=1209917 RepID=A0AAI9VGG5_9PEZI|nr:hypothetical protein CCUS01_03649 [Colletotrichum cuscutae]
MTEFLTESLAEFKPNTVIFRAYVALIKFMPIRKEHFKRSGVLSRALEEAFFYAYRAESESGSSESELSRPTPFWPPPPFGHPISPS